MNVELKEEGDQRSHEGGLRAYFNIKIVKYIRTHIVAIRRMYSSRRRDRRFRNIRILVHAAAQE